MNTNGFSGRKRPACAGRTALTVLAFVLAFVLASDIHLALAQAGAQAESTVFTIIVTRHGVRAISQPDVAGAKYAWPDWGPVNHGYNDELTAHGYRLMKRMGEFYRHDQHRKGLPVDCPAKTSYVYADVPPSPKPPPDPNPAKPPPAIANPAQRTLGTAHALIEGLCGSPDALEVFHATNMSAKDPIFDATNRLKIDVKASTAAVAKVAGNPLWTIVQQHASDFAAFQELLDTRCDGGGCKPIISGYRKNTIIKGDKLAAPEGPIATASALAALKGPIATASAFSEDVFLEFAQCRPKKEIAQCSQENAQCSPEKEIAKLDAMQLQTDLEAGTRLHVVAYDVNARNEYNPRVRGGTLLATIAAMLDQKAGRAAYSRIKLPVDLLTGKTLVIFSGHDTQLGALGGILNAHWNPGDGLVPDDMPPGSALIFDLVRGPGSDYEVSLSFASRTLNQFRDGQPFMGPLKPVACGPKNDYCVMGLTDLESRVLKLDKDGFVVKDKVVNVWDASSKPSPQDPGSLAKLKDPPWTESQCRGP
jgi:4-phytase/acid phosphatase